jgi:hypothetical protein
MYTLLIVEIGYAYDTYRKHKGEDDTDCRIILGLDIALDPSDSYSADQGSHESPNEESYRTVTDQYKRYEYTRQYGMG